MKYTFIPLFPEKSIGKNVAFIFRGKGLNRVYIVTFILRK